MLSGHSKSMIFQNTHNRLRKRCRLLIGETSDPSPACRSELHCFYHFVLVCFPFICLLVSYSHLSSALLVDLVLSISWIWQNTWQWTFVEERDRHPDALVLLSIVSVVAVLLLLFPLFYSSLVLYPLWGEPRLALDLGWFPRMRAIFPFIGSSFVRLFSLCPPYMALLSAHSLRILKVGDRQSCVLHGNRSMQTQRLWCMFSDRMVQGHPQQCLLGTRCEKLCCRKIFVVVTSRTVCKPRRTAPCVQVLVLTAVAGVSSHFQLLCFLKVVKLEPDGGVQIELSGCFTSTAVARHTFRRNIQDHNAKTWQACSPRSGHQDIFICETPTSIKKSWIWKFTTNFQVTFSQIQNQ